MGLAPRRARRSPPIRKFEKVTFTGSTEVGRSIGAAAARNFAAATLELGGKGAVLIFNDMEMERAVNGAAFAAFIAAGQTCVCGSRILVQRTMYSAFLDRFWNESRNDPPRRPCRSTDAAWPGHFREIQAARFGNDRSR